MVHCDKWPLGGASGARKNDALKWVHSNFFLIKSKNTPPIFFGPGKFGHFWVRLDALISLRGGKAMFG